MSISGIGSYNSANCYQGNMNKNNKQSVNSFISSPNITLHVMDEKSGDKALTSVGFANGGSASVYRADDYSEKNPQYLVKYWDKSGAEQEYKVNPKEVDPTNASYIEMLAYSTYTDVQGFTSNAYGDFLKAAGGVNGELSYDAENINEKTNFMSLIKEFMQMQYDTNNLNGYLSFKQFYDYMDNDQIGLA